MECELTGTDSVNGFVIMIFCSSMYSSITWFVIGNSKDVVWNSAAFVLLGNLKFRFSIRTTVKYTTITM